jgi:hypothetical protein
VKVLAGAIEARDPCAAGHAERVATLAVAIGRELGWDANQLAVLELGATLHDVGKIAVAEHVLRKPGPLDPHEWEQANCRITNLTRGGIVAAQLSLPKEQRGWQCGSKVSTSWRRPCRAAT